MSPVRVIGMYALLAMFLFGLVNSVRAQIPDSIRTALSYFPLNEGDIWQYELISPDGGSLATGVYLYRRVESDSLPANGTEYRSLLEKYFGPDERRLYRIDSTDATVYTYDPEKAGLRGFDNDELPFLLLPTGSTLRSEVKGDWSLICLWIPDEMVLGTLRRVWSCTEHLYNDSELRKLTSGLGLYHWFFHLAGFIWQWDLIFANTEDGESGIIVTTEPPEIVTESYLNIYPNPVRAGESITIEYSLDLPALSILLTDIQGKRVETSPLSSATTERIQFRIVDRLAPGIYFLSVRSASTVSRGKIVVVN